MCESKLKEGGFIGKGSGDAHFVAEDSSNYHLCLTGKPTEDVGRLLNRHVQNTISWAEYNVLNHFLEHINKLEQRIRELERDK